MYKGDFSPDEIREISSNLTNLFRIPEGSIPLNRGLGLSWQTVSQIPPDMENDYAVDLIEKAEKLESRASVGEVAFHYDGEGNVTVDVVMERGEEDGK